MWRKIGRLLNSYVVTNIKFILIKIFHFNNFSFHFNNLISSKNIFDIQNKGSIYLGKNINIPYKSIFGVREHGKMEISDGVFVNNNCQIIAHKNIKIGKNVCIGPNTIIMDHDHVISPDGIKKNKFVSKDIVIEDGVWIGANCVILKGAKIGKNSVIAAGSVVNSEVSENKVLIQKRTNEFKEI